MTSHDWISPRIEDHVGANQAAAGVQTAGEDQALIGDVDGLDGQIQHEDAQHTSSPSEEPMKAIGSQAAATFRRGLTVRVPNDTFLLLLRGYAMFRETVYVDCFCCPADDHSILSSGFFRWGFTHLRRRGLMTRPESH